MGALTISGSTVDVQISALTPGVAATSLGKAEDAAHTTADVGIMALAVRESTATDLSAGNTNGDYEPLQVDANGRLWVNSTIAAPGAADLTKLEDAAHTSGDAGVMSLAVRAAAPTDRSVGATDGDYEPLAVDALGRLWSREAGHYANFIDNTAVSTSPAYTALDLVGGIRTVANFALITGGSAVLHSISVFDDANQKATLEFLFFNATPSGGTYTDNGAVSWAAGDSAKFIGKVVFAAADYTTFGSKAVASLKNINLPLTVAATSLFVLVATPSSTPTYVATTDLHVVYGVRY